MTVIGIVLAISLVSGCATAVLVLRWPRLDPVTPRLSSGTIREEVWEHSTLRRFARSRLDPAETTGLLLTVALAVVGVGLLAIGSLVFVAKGRVGKAQRVDQLDFSAAITIHPRAQRVDSFNVSLEPWVVSVLDVVRRSENLAESVFDGEATDLADQPT